MSLFVLDSTRDNTLLNKEVLQSPKVDKRFSSKSLINAVCDANINEETDADDDCNAENITEDELYGLPSPDIDISDIIDATLEITDRKPSKVEIEIDDYMERLQELFKKALQPKPKFGKYLIDLDPKLADELFTPITGEKLIKTDVEKVMATSNIPQGLEQVKGLPNLSKKQQIKMNRINRAKTKGENWFNMPAPEMTEEIKNDLKVLQMRSALDPKHFYKKNDLKVLPKYFQVGTVQHSPLDYYSERNTRRNKKRSIVDELLADNETQQYTKRKYKEIMEQKQKYAHRKNMKKMKKLKKHK